MTDTSQAFDIIPRNQVKPSNTSRPVITTTQPEQLDNTLKTAPLPPIGLSMNDGDSKAAGSQLKHKPLNLTLSSADKQIADDQTADDDGETAPEGVKLSDLMAKRASTTASPATDADPGSGTDTGSNSPAPEDGVPVATESGTAMAAKPADHPKADADSVDRLFQDDTQPAPQAHSAALKDELASFGDGSGPDDGANDSQLNESERPHHELYGGKPVIVIHKGYGSHSALNAFLWLLVCLLLAVIIVDVLLDMDIITTSFSVPHTDWF